MPYNPTYGSGGWAAGTGTPATAAALNDRDQQYTEAVNSLLAIIFGPFVVSGLVATKDGTVATQLDITSGSAYIGQADSTARYRSISSTTKSVSSPSATYFLDLNPDGTYNWATSHSSDPNHMTIATVTTDGSGNIATVTDTRPTSPQLFASMIGTLLPPPSMQSPNVAKVLHAAGSGTSSHTILTYAVPSDGHFRIAGSFRIGTNGNVTVKITYTDAVTSNSRTTYVQANGDNISSYVTLDAAAVNTGQFAGVPVVINAKAGHNIVIAVQNSGGGGSDDFSFFIEKLG